MEDGGRCVGYSLSPVLANDRERETPCHPAVMQCCITFMSFNRQIQEVNMCVVPSKSASMVILIYCSFLNV